ncbi:hypothetical protein SAMN05443574_108108 [Haloarcula vallismortis]|uniref:Uncharacterized protein n=2 Tax=Haloarcula vallismortis TaxID=28442 RepID=M0JAW7_HALVA|nr:hypothetical protein [Haloarcula vallismortis]EMA05488.1 hypothetical protein C437_12580 [Haloarcula vallismortis ATCC 29715]SDW87538.1 hypothetical protein SAMN05443574_108108 [Haloarcula vallismortis]
MANIRVKDWTKEKLQGIRNAESHSSYDSVIKTLLKDRELAKYADDDSNTAIDESIKSQDADIDKMFDDLTVLAELTGSHDDVLFLWCPNCGNELVHLTVERPLGRSVFEMECQRCLTHLDSQAIVAIELRYPLEQKMIEGQLQADLKSCVVDYWDRTLKGVTTDTVETEPSAARLVWQFDQYHKQFDWDWPTAVPTVSFVPGVTYRNTATDERIEAVEAVTEHRNALDSYKVRRSTAGGDVISDQLDSSTIVDWIVNRELVVTEQSIGTTKLTT